MRNRQSTTPRIIRKPQAKPISIAQLQEGLRIKEILHSNFRLQAWFYADRTHEFTGKGKSFNYRYIPEEEQPEDAEKYYTDISQKHSEPTKHQCEAGLSP